MKAVPYNRQEHYLTLADWWEQSDERDTDPESSLSPFGGVVVDDEGEVVMAAFLYLCIGTKVCFMERLVGRPGLSLKEAGQASKRLFAHLLREAFTAGYEQIFIHACRDGMSKTLADSFGFSVLESSAKLMSRRI